jgi:hypothetical protein
MAQDSRDLLAEILNVCRKISSKLDQKSSSAKEDQQSKANNVAGKGAAMSGFKGFDGFEMNPAQNKNLRETAETMKIIGESLVVLSKGMWKFWLVPNNAKKSVYDFMNSMLQLSRVSGGIGKGMGFKLVAEGMVTLGEALPKLAKGIFWFGLMARTGLVSATVAGLTSLYGVMLIIGNPATQKIVLVAAAALAAVGVALNGIANVLKSIALVILSFAASIVIMVGAIYLASKLFIVGPLKAMLIVVGAIGILAAGFALIGVLAPLIMLAGPAIAAMGLGLASLGAGLLVFLGSIALIKMILGEKSPMEMMKGFLMPILVIGLIFAGLGLVAPFIWLGAKAAQQMGKGLIFLAGGILAIGVVGKLLNMMGVDIKQVSSDFAMSILKLGLMFAGIALLGVLIVPGTLVLMAMAASIIVFALITLGIGAVIAKLGGAAGLETAKNNIGSLISSVLMGVINGVSRGLLGENGDSKGFFGKVATMGKNVAILIGSIFLLMGVSYALIMFGQAIKSFTQAGVIKTVTGYNKDGSPIFGDSVNVVSAGENIANSIGSFFRTLTTTFKDTSIIPDKLMIEDMVDILMGRQGVRLYGLRFGANRPGLLDAIGKFSEIISTFAKVDQIPIFDKNGKVSGFTNPAGVASNIVASLIAFFKGFADNKSMLEGISTDSIKSVAKILMGTDGSFKLYGLKFGASSPGILEPLMKFAELLQAMGADPSKMTYVDADGKTQTMDVAQSAGNIVKALSTFASSISKSMSVLDPVKTNKSGLTALQSFDKLNEQFAKLIKQKDGLMQTADILSKMSLSIEKLAGSLLTVDADKLASLASISTAELQASIENKESWLEKTVNKLKSTGPSPKSSQEISAAPVVETTTPVAVTPTSKTAEKQPTIEQVDWALVSDSIGEAVASYMKNTTFNFVFDTANTDKASGKMFLNT